jgi:di/tricarboxylate transporter
MILVLAVLGLTVVLIVTEWIAVDLAALLVLVMLGLMDLVPVNQLFAGFQSNAVIAIMAVMIMGAGLDRTGVLNHAAALILRLSGGTRDRLLLALSVIAGGISGFMQNPVVTSLFLPVTARISARTGYPLSQLLMPMAFCIILGGSITTVGNSPMILLNDLIESANRNLPQGAQTVKSLSIFSVAPIGISMLLLGLFYFRLFGQARVPSYEDKQSVTPETTQSYFQKSYGSQGELIELRIDPTSPLAGSSIGQIEALPGAPLLLALHSADESRLAPPFDAAVKAGDAIAVLGTPEQITTFADLSGLQVEPGGLQRLQELFDPETAGISEAVIPPGSRFIGQAVGDLRLRKRFGINPLAVHRGNQQFRDDLRGIVLQAGDCLVFHSAWANLAEYQGERDFIVVTDYPKTDARPHKVWHALIFFLLGFGLAWLGHVPLSIALMAGAAGMMVSGVLTMDEAYKAISWKTFFSLACLIPLGVAVDSTGAAAWIAQESLRLLGRWPPWALQLVLGLLTTLATTIMSQVGATVLMVPMAINFALAVNGNPTEFALIVALCASNNFLTASNPVIALISGPGGYKLRDYLRVGVPLTIGYLLVTIIAVNILFHFGRFN